MTNIRFLLSNLQKESHEISKAHGFWDEEDSGKIDKASSDHTKILLMISELTEAFEELRAGHDYQEVYYTTDKDNRQKPEGVGIELVDALIRIVEFAERRNINLSEMYALKTEYNKGRPYKHGKSC